MNFERMRMAILTLRNVHMQGLPFNINNWYEDDEDPLNCGTAACAFGWVARQPWAQQEGLKIDADYGIVFGVKSRNPYTAATRFFDISIEWAHWLFDPDCYDVLQTRVTAEHVIERMEAVIRKHGEEPIAKQTRPAKLVVTEVTASEEIFA